MFAVVNSFITSIWGGTVSGIILGFLPAFFTKKDKSNPCQDSKIITSSDNLFKKSNLNFIKADSALVKACAVDDFDLGYDSTINANHNNRGNTSAGLNNGFSTSNMDDGSNPFNWDLHSLIMDNNKHDMNNNNYQLKQAENQHQVVTSTLTASNALFSEDEYDDSEDEDTVVCPLDDELNLGYVHSFNPDNIATMEMVSFSYNPLTQIPIPIPTPNLPVELEERESSNCKRVKKVHSIEGADTPPLLMRSKTHTELSSSQNNSNTPKLLSVETAVSSPGVSSPNSSISNSSGNNSASNGKVFTCKVCSTQFNVKGYLTRHMKKHATNKPFMCPFYNINSNSKCHLTGGFSRRDTFKTHLKALHFVYPTGTRCGERVDKRGRCAGCFKEFESNLNWLNSHVAVNKCKGMVSQYK